MINIDSLTNYLQINLNNELRRVLSPYTTSTSSTVQFRLFTDLGDFKKAYKPNPTNQPNIVLEYINGIVTTVNSDVTTLNTELGVAVIELLFEFAVPVRNPKGYTMGENNTDSNQPTYPLVVKSAVDNFFAQNRIYSTNINGKSYTGGLKFEFLDTGTRNQQVGIGDNVSYSASITYFLVEDGINSSQIAFYIDGIRVPFENAIPNRATVKQSDVASDITNHISKSIVTSSAFAVDLNLPSTNTTIGNYLVDWLLNGEPNVVHFLEIQWGTEREPSFYLVTFSDVNGSVQDIKTAGHSLSIVEIKEAVDFMNFPETFGVFRVSSGLASNRTISISERASGTVTGAVYVYVPTQGVVKLDGAGSTFTTGSLINASNENGDIYIVLSKKYNISVSTELIQ